MLRRSLIACALVLLAGCQDYRFNPVGKCVIQPGASRIQLAGQATADILFVVDDSGSMQSKQDRLAANFKSFIDALAATQSDRKARGLDALDFHIAVTTSSVFDGEQPSPGPPTCQATGAGGALQCNITNPTFSWTAPYTYPCTTPGAICADLVASYTNVGSGCTAGVATAGAPYPAGDFVAAGSNPRVLHFTKNLDWQSSATDPTIQGLVAQFKQNIAVGTCGSGMEQHLEASRLAVQKAIDQKQPGVAKDEWPHPGAKLVVVWVGDEDDCSSPKDPNKALFFTPGKSSPGTDVCTADETSSTPKMFPVSTYVNYFATLGRAFGAAFIYSADPTSCADDGSGNVVCTPGTCSCVGSSDATCGGFAAGSRFHDLSAGLRSKGFSTLDASVCDADFAKTLAGIAELVKPPPGLTLPTQPASSEVALLRIESADGKTSKLCTGPATTSAEVSTDDWYFVDCKTGQPVLDRTTSCITINHATGKCEANPGETYVAQYLGLVPQPSGSSPGGCATANDCAVLGVTDAAHPEKDWTCVGATAAQRGTCVCNGG
jgi:hypothetical protein